MGIQFTQLAKAHGIMGIHFVKKNLNYHLYELETV